MSKFHKIHLDDEVFVVRDVPVLPFSKKFRVGPYELRDKIVQLMDDEGKSLLLKYINSRVHFFIGEEMIAKAEDHELAEFLQQNIHLRNEIII